jgi:hypothetical protein
MQVLASGASGTAADATAAVGKRAGSMTAQQPLPAILAETAGKRRSLPPLPHQVSSDDTSDHASQLYCRHLITTLCEAA